MLRAMKICAWSFDNLQAAEVLVRHHFELTDTKYIHHNARKFLPQDNQIIREKIENLLKSGITKPASSSWPFLVVITTKKDRKSRFGASYHLLKQKDNFKRLHL